MSSGYPLCVPAGTELKSGGFWTLCVLDSPQPGHTHTWHVEPRIIIGALVLEYSTDLGSPMILSGLNPHIGTPRESPAPPSYPLPSEKILECDLRPLAVSVLGGPGLGNRKNWGCGAAPLALGWDRGKGSTRQTPHTPTPLTSQDLTLAMYKAGALAAIPAASSPQVCSWKPSMERGALTCSSGGREVWSLTWS